MFLVSLLHILLLGALKVSIGDLLQPLLGGLTVNGAADTLGGAEDLPDQDKRVFKSVRQRGFDQRYRVSIKIIDK